LLQKAERVGLPEFENWTITKTDPLRIPQQKNGYDCGVSFWNFLSNKIALIFVLPSHRYLHVCLFFLQFLT
jgi:hypothetical protein